MGDVDPELLEIIKAVREGAPALLATRYSMGEWMLLLHLCLLPNCYTSQAVITVALVLYDHILTFHDELEYIWEAHKWLNKLIFVVNRYIVEVTLIGTAYGS